MRSLWVLVLFMTSNIALPVQIISIIKAPASMISGLLLTTTLQSNVMMWSNMAANAQSVFAGQEVWDTAATALLYCLIIICSLKIAPGLQDGNIVVSCGFQTRSLQILRKTSAIVRQATSTAIADIAFVCSCLKDKIPRISPTRAGKTK